MKLSNNLKYNESIKNDEIFVSKKSENINNALQNDLKENLGISGIESLKVFSNYIVDGLTDEEFQKTIKTVLSEAPVDDVFYNDEFEKISKGKKVLVIEAKPGQYDARVEAVKDNISLLSGKDSKVRYKHIIVFDGDISEKDLEKIKDYLINPNENFNSSLEDKILERKIQKPENNIILNGFKDLKTDEEFTNFIGKHGLPVELEDIRIVQDYFKNEEKREPTKVEMLLIGTYWSDHCRHTTFLTQIENISFKGDEKLVKEIKKTNSWYREKSKEKGKNKNSFMQIATSSLRFLENDPEFKGTKLLDASEEDNAASYKCKIELEDGETEDWIIMFKNETHNSPTEAEPFGGAATCIGGAIRDTLSGRAFTFAGIRVSGSSNPTEPITKTLKGKLSQRAISIGSALGYASYGNQIGLATTKVKEYFHPGYKAKRFECGYVLAAVKQENINRRSPKKGDVVIMAGGHTGRDGVGGATISSKQDGSASKEQKGSHVQKGNPVEERKFQRLNLNPNFTKAIIKSNDFGAGGVSVALGELARGVDISLDEVAKYVKYQGLSDEELVISESQERMSYIISPEDVDKVLKLFKQENLNAFVVGKITTDEDNKSEDRLVMSYEGKTPVNISRNFLDKNGAERRHNAEIVVNKVDFFNKINNKVEDFIKKGDFVNAVKTQLSLLNNSSQKGLQGGFDSSVGASTVLTPYGGKYQNSPQVASVNKIPVGRYLENKTAIASSFGYNPELMSQNTYIGGIYSVIEAISSLVAVGGKYDESWLSLQEYFGSLSDDEKYGQVYAGLLGTLKSLYELKVAAIGGKDSMSGTYKYKDKNKTYKIDVPPTIIAFANTPLDSEKVVSAEFKKAGNKILCFAIEKGKNGLPDFNKYKKYLKKVQKLINKGKVYSSSVVGNGGIIETISKLSLGNKIGFKFKHFSEDDFKANIGDIILEVDKNTAEDFQDLIIGKTTDDKMINFQGRKLRISKIQEALEGTLSSLWDINKGKGRVNNMPLFKHRIVGIDIYNSRKKIIALIPVFPGTNSEIDTKYMLIRSGFEVREHIFNTLNNEQFKKSRRAFASKLKNTDLLVIPGGFSWGDEPGASGIGAVNIFKSLEIKDNLQNFFNRQDTLSIGICNGAQILTKLGVVDDGEIKDELMEDDMIITHNDRLNHETGLVRNRIISALSPFFNEYTYGNEYLLNISHGEGKFQITDKKYKQYLKNGQIALQYQSEDGLPTNKYNGSKNGISGMTSPDGRILAMMPHVERVGLNVAKNVPGDKILSVFKNAREWLGYQ